MRLGRSTSSSPPRMDKRSRLSALYMYVLPQTLEFNGHWGGEDGSTPADIWIENNMLTRDSSPALAL